MAQLNRICGLHYNVLFRVKVSKRRIPMNVPIGATFNVERENLRANGDGSDVQLGFDNPFPFHQGKISLSPMEKILINFW